MHCPAGNATDPIWRVLAFSDRISCWTPLRPQHSNPNPNSWANQLWCSDFLTPPTPLIIPHKLLESLMPLKNWCSIHARWLKSSLKHFICFCGIFSKFKTEFYCISFFLTPRLHFWNSPAVTIMPVQKKSGNLLNAPLIYNVLLQIKMFLLNDSHTFFSSMMSIDFVIKWIFLLYLNIYLSFVSL